MNPTPAQQRQREEALASGNRIRLANAALRRELRELPELDARQRLATILEDPSDMHAKAVLEKLLRAIHRFGDQTTRRVLLKAGVHAASKRIGELTPRQRETVAAILRDPRLVTPHTSRPALDQRSAA